MLSKKCAVMALTLLISLQAATTQAGFYQTIGKPSLQAETSAEQMQNETKSDLNISDDATETKVDLTIVLPTAHEELKTWFELLEHAYSHIPQERIISDDAAEKLNLLSEVRKIFPTITTAGKAGVAQELTTGTNSLRNQEIVRYFTDKPRVVQQINQALNKINSGMGLYFTFFKKEGKAEKEVFANVVFPPVIGYANKSTSALFAKRLFAPGMANINILPLYTPLLGLTAWYSDPSSIRTNLAMGLAIDALRAYQSWQIISLDNAILENLQTRLIGVASVIEGLEELNSTAKKSNIPALIELVQDINILLQNKETSTDIGSMLNYLQTNTFQGAASYWSDRPRILATYTLLQENKMALIPALRAAGTIDALQAAAELVTNQSGQRAQYSFVEFIEGTQPVLDLQNFWNPLIDPSVVILNTVHLGNGGDQNMLLTGPNGSGKSANMSGITLSGVILPHAFGIASAKHVRVTPFTHINTYLNEREDLQQNLSTFMAEAKKLDDICKQITGLKQNERCFTIMDEMLKGTVEDAGAQRVYEAGIKLAQKPQSIVIMATHFEKPTKLEITTNGGFMNYHVGLVEKEDGQFKRTFELVRGANLWWFQDASKRNRFINWLTSLNN